MILIIFVYYNILPCLLQRRLRNIVLAVRCGNHAHIIHLTGRYIHAGIWYINFCIVHKAFPAVLFCEHGIILKGVCIPYLAAKAYCEGIFLISVLRARLRGQLYDSTIQHIPRVQLGQRKRYGRSAISAYSHTFTQHRAKRQLILYCCVIYWHLGGIHRHFPPHALRGKIIFVSCAFFEQRIFLFT